MLKLGLSFLSAIVAIFVMFQSCGKSSSGGGGDDNNTVISSDKQDGSEGANLEIDGDVLGEDEAEISEGSSIANDVTGSYLNLPPGITQASNPINIASDKSLTADQLQQLTLSIPLKDANGTPIPAAVYARILVMYHIKLPDESLAVGYIPYGQLSIDTGTALALQSGIPAVKFKLKGFGVYQAALLPEGSTPPVLDKSVPTTTPIPTVASSQANFNMLTVDLFENSNVIFSGNAAIAGTSKVTHDMTKQSTLDDFELDGISLVSGKGIKSSGDGEGQSKCFDAGMDIEFSSIQVYADRPTFARIPDGGAKTDFAFANIDASGLVFSTHFETNPPVETSGVEPAYSLTPVGTQEIDDDGIINKSWGFNESAAIDGHIKTNLLGRGTSNAIIEDGNSPFTFMALIEANSGTMGSAFGLDKTSEHFSLEFGAVDMNFRFGDATHNINQKPSEAFLFTATGGQELTKTFINGSEETSIANDGIPGAQALYLGAQSATGGGITSPFEGSLDEVAVFNRRMDAAEILKFHKHMNRKFLFGITFWSDPKCEDDNDEQNKRVVPFGLKSPVKADLTGVSGRYYSYGFAFTAANSGDSAHISKIELNKGFEFGQSQLEVISGIAFTTLSRFDAAPNDGKVKFQLSADDGTTWMYFDSKWLPATSHSTSNTLAEVNANIATLSQEPGVLKIRAIFTEATATLSAMTVDYK